MQIYGGKLGNSMTWPPNLTPEEKPQTIEFSLDDDYQKTSNFVTKADAINATGKPVDQKSITNLLINSGVMLSQGEEHQQLYKVI